LNGISSNTRLNSFPIGKVETDDKPSLNTAGDAIHTDTVIIGAGPAGLAVGACLQLARVPYIILEQNNRVGSTWHQHYDRLCLHTDKAHSELPYLRFPKQCARYPSRLDLINYLDTYTSHFQLKPKFGQQVISARYVGQCWEIRTQDRVYYASNLVVATGYTREPNVPDWEGQDLFEGPTIHSSQYRNGKPFTGQKVLVIGFGNSGGEIALDLWEHGAQPSIAVRSGVNVIPRDLFGIPILSIGIVQRKLPLRLADAINGPILRAVFGDLSKYGLRKLPHGPAAQIQYASRIPLIDIGTTKVIKRGRITVYCGVERFTEDGIVFSDGRQVNFDAVILATGFRPRVNKFLQGNSAVYDEEGKPCSSGHEMAIPGLFFCGYYVPPTGMLREIGMEAKRISAAIARKQRVTR
jgi:cation diffusion facilitator CzcD-associated flavoprotein CzcO